MNIDQLTQPEIDELVSKAQAHYREKIRPLVYPQQKGRMLVIDLESHDYEIDDHAIVASHRLRERRPDVSFFTIKIGYKASFKAGYRLSYAIGGLKATGFKLADEEC